MNKNKILLEGCIDSIEQANHYHNVGIDRLELCSQLELDGLCPHYELVDYCINELKIDSVIMLRLRNDFNFLPEDLLIYKHYIDQAKKIGARNFIFGFTIHGKVDVVACKQIINLLDGCNYAFHMAIDTVLDYDLAIKTLIDLKFSWVLTGGTNTLPAIDNIKNIKHLIELYGHEITFLIGRKVNRENWESIAQQTGARCFHGRKIK